VAPEERVGADRRGAVIGRGDVLDRFTEAECRNCFKHCGYRYT
jgi:hypothetical protein